MKYKEYLETATTERKNELLTDEDIRKLFTTPLGELDTKYRNLLECPAILADEYAIKEFFNNFSFKEMVSEYIKEFEEFEFLDGDDYAMPFFVYKDESNTPCGFIVYIKPEEDSPFIENIILFSFNVNDKSFGRQIWIDLEKDLDNKVKEYETISWFAKETNQATTRYDYLINKYGGTKKRISNSIVEYTIKGDI